jgi:hypothetical protein
MSEHILAACGEIKEILVKTEGTIAQKLLAICAAAGLTDKDELADLLGVTERYIRSNRNQSSGSRVPEAEFRNRNQSSEIRKPSSGSKKVSPTPPSKNNTSLELLSSPTSSSTAAREKVAAAPLKVDLVDLAERVTAACNGSLASIASAPGLLSMSTPLMWLENGADLDRDVIPTLTVAGRKYHGKKIRTWDYFTPMVAEAKAKRESGKSKFSKPQMPVLPQRSTAEQAADLEAERKQMRAKIREARMRRGEIACDPSQTSSEATASASNEPTTAANTRPVPSARPSDQQQASARSASAF